VAFTFSHRVQGSAQIITIQGFVDGPAGRQLLEHVKKQAGGPTPNFVFDFSACTLVNSTAMGELIEMVSLNVEKRTVRFFLCGISPTLRFALNEVGILQLARECNSLANAIVQANTPD